MKSVFLLSCTLLLGILLFGACTQPTVATPSPSVKATAAAPKAGWEQKWETVLAEAKREGSVIIYTSWVAETRTGLTRAFKEKYGIDLEFSPFSRGAEMSAKAAAEKRAGLYLADAFAGGPPSLLLIIKPEGLLGPIEPLLIFPEVLDPKAWRGGELPFMDKDHLALSLIGMVIPTVLYNTNLVKEGEITNHKDLLKPQYKGKITINDPTVNGAGQGTFSHLYANLWGEAETVDFLRRLVRDQEAVIQRDNRAHIESVARGKYAIALSPLPDLVSQMTAQGAPVKVAPLKDDNRITAAAGGLGVPTKFAHPNAATVFLNWILTREAQSVLAKGFGNPSLRLDASTEGIDPIFIPKPGQKYFPETEEFIKGPMNSWLGIARKTIEEAMR